MLGNEIKYRFEPKNNFTEAPRLVAVRITGSRYPSVPLMGYIIVEGKTFYVDILAASEDLGDKVNICIIPREYYLDSTSLDRINSLCAGRAFVYEHINEQHYSFSMPPFKSQKDTAANRHSYKVNVTGELAEENNDSESGINRWFFKLLKNTRRRF